MAAQIELINIPAEVIADHLLKFLPWNDILRLRRVCRWTKGITDGYLGVKPNRAPEIEIDEGNEKNLGEFIAMGIPTTKLFLNNKSGYYFYTLIDEKLQEQFLIKFSPIITQLRVTQLTLRPYGRELDFICGLKKLISFEAGSFGHGKKQAEDDWGPPEKMLMKAAKNDPRLTSRDLPTLFHKLRVIKIGQDEIFCKSYNVPNRIEDVLVTCPQLQHATLPYDSTTYESEEGARPHTSLASAFDNLQVYIAKRPNRFYPSEAGEVGLDSYDFENYHNDIVQHRMEAPNEAYEKLATIWIASRMFLPTLMKALERGIQLKNVSPNWFIARFMEEFENNYASPEIGVPVVSLVGLDPCILDLDMPNLERIRIPRTSACNSGLVRPEWPSLKILEICVNGNTGFAWDFVRKLRFADIGRVNARPTQLLFKFLFGNGIKSEKMTELSLKFVEGMVKREVAVPKVEEIVGSCPNLKRIKLENWLGTNKQLVTLWKGLSKLEEISLENCGELGNVAFVGDDVENPVFLGLENLKKLSLKGLDKMVKVTDTLFILVLAKMNLKELVLTADKPLEKVTKKGLIALLEGPFAGTIERFQFHEWSLAEMTSEEFEEMGKKFRSSEMI